MIALVLGILFFGGFLYKLRDVRRSPRNLGAWAVLTLFAALTIVALIREGVPLFGAYGSENPGVLTRNIALVLGFGGLQLWHLHYSQVVRTPIIRARIEATVLFAVVTALCLIASSLSDGVSLTTPADPQQVGDLTNGWVQLFYRIAGLYTWYTLGCQLIWNLGAARLLKQRWLRVAVLLTAAGDLFLIIAQVNRAVGQTSVYLTGEGTPPLLDRGETVFILLGMPPLLVGLLLPPVVNAVRRLMTSSRQLKHYRALRELHDAIRWTYPGMIRPDSPGDGPAVARTPRSSRELRFAYEERIQQCRDGYSRSRGEDLDGPDNRPRHLARTLRALPVDEPGDLRDEQDETRHLVAVSRALRRSSADWKAAEPDQPSHTSG